jgi:glycosyltransferase involved in cell wall biosynthesis
MPDERPHLLILEPDPRGHATEWIGHIAAAVGDTFAVTFALAPELAASLSTAAAERNVRFVALAPREQAMCLHRSLVVSACARWRIMRRYMKRVGATHGFFLSIDHLSLPLALRLSAGHGRISGFLFRPSVHYGGFESRPARFRERLRDWRKDLLYRGMLRNPTLDTVLTLDPYFPDFARRRYRGGDKVAFVPDPVSPAAMARRSDGAPDARRARLLLFGEITARKGVFTLFDALARLPAGIAQSLHVEIAGRHDPAIRSEIARAAGAALRGRPELRLRIEDRRLPDAELAARVGDSDVILAPYQRFVGSSGVLLWAAATGVPVICQDYGLLGRLVQDHALGIAVDTSDSAALAGAIERALRYGPDRLFDRRRAAAFARGCAAQRFGEAVLSCAARDRPAIAAQGK